MRAAKPFFYFYHGDEYLRRNCARPKQARASRLAQVDDGRFDANLAGTAVEDRFDAPAEAGLDVSGGGRADVTEGVRAGRSQRPAGELEDFPRQRSGLGRTQCHLVSWPEVTISGTHFFRGSTSVSGPGQKWRTRMRAAALNSTHLRALRTSRRSPVYAQSTDHWPAGVWRKIPRQAFAWVKGIGGEAVDGFLRSEWRPVLRRVAASRPADGGCAESACRCGRASEKQKAGAQAPAQCERRSGSGLQHRQHLAGAFDLFGHTALLLGRHAGVFAVAESLPVSRDVAGHPLVADW